MHYETHVITLDPTNARFAAFQAANAHLSYQVLQGIRGSGLPRSERLSQNLVTAECLDQGLVTDGEVGVAASHLLLWREAIYRKTPLLILEDDVITHPQLAHVVSHLDMPQADMVFFAVNTDTYLGSCSPEGLCEISSFDVRYPTPAQIQTFLQQTDLRRLSLRRMVLGFGMCCYLVTPEGAAKLVQHILPLRGDIMRLPVLPGATVRGTSIDRRLNILLGSEIRAFIMRPFLAWTPNVESSTRPPGLMR